MVGATETRAVLWEWECNTLLSNKGDPRVEVAGVRFTHGRGFC